MLLQLHVLCGVDGAGCAERDLPVAGVLSALRGEGQQLQPDRHEP